MTAIEKQGAAAKAAARVLASAGTKQKNQALCAIADALCARKAEILAANAEDLAAARAEGMRESLLDRLALTEARIDGVSAGYPGLATPRLPPDGPPGADDHTLLYLPFDDRPTPEGFFVKGEVSLSEPGAGRFGRALTLGRGAYAAGPASQYLELPEGTIELWVRHHWPGNDGASHAFVSVPGWNGMWFGKD